MKSRILIALAGVALALSAPQASAGLVDVKLQGLVEAGGTDGLGVFNHGVAVGDNAYYGTKYTAEFWFDTTLGRDASTVAPAFAGKIGGTFWSQPNPAVFAAVTVNGVTVSFDPNYQGSFIRDLSGSKSSVSYFAMSLDGDSRTESGAFISKDDASLSSFPVIGPIDFPHDGFSHPGSGDAAASFSMTTASMVSMFVAEVNMITISAIPEPSSWAMMLIGFAGIGLMAYRRRHRGPVPAVRA